MVPVSQSILADSFPPAKRGQAFALFGVAVVVAPVVGPTLGGWLSDNWSWRWCFLINGPVGLLAIALIVADPARAASAAEERSELQARQAVRSRRLRAGRDLPRRARSRARPRPGGRLVRLDLHRRRSRSSAALAFVLMIPWEISRRNPMIDIRHGGDAPVRRLLPRDAGDRRHPARDDAVPAAAGAAGLRLHRDLGRPRAVAGRPRHHGR